VGYQTLAGGQLDSLDARPGGQTGCSLRISQAGEMQENFRLPPVLEIILKGRIGRIGRGGTIGKSNRRDDHLAGRVFVEVIRVSASPRHFVERKRRA